MGEMKGKYHLLLFEWMTACSFVDFSKVHFIYAYVLGCKVSYHFQKYI